MILTRRELSQAMKVTSPTISRWIEAGLPQVEKSKFDFKEFVVWYLFYKTGGDPAKARSRRDSALAERTEIEVGILKGELLRANELEKTVGSALGALRAQFLNLPIKVAEAAVSCTSVEEIENAARAEICDAFNEFRANMIENGLVRHEYDS